jgi:protein-S-isoprenylcysteine O-methyltransferase Ste14
MSAAGHIGTRIPCPPLLYLAAIAAGVLLHEVYPLPWIGQPLSDILFAFGLLVLAGGVALFAAAIAAMRRAKTAIDPRKAPDHLVTGGPFAISRNPIYLADTLIVIGLGLLFQVAWLVVAALVATLLTTRLAIVPEEKVLAERFGKRYRDYARRIRRWI